MTKLFEVVFEEVSDESEITSEHNLWTAPSLFAASAAASAHAYEYGKTLKMVREAGIIVRDVGFYEGQQLLDRSIDYGLLEGEGNDPEKPE